MRKLIYGSLFVMLFGCALPVDGPLPKAMLVGLWEENDSTMNAIILRRPDGTYRRKQIQLYDYSKPALACESSGRWRVDGKHYIACMDFISSPVWKKEIGKTWSVDIVSTSNKKYKYISTDGANVEELKIGEASDAGFESSTVKLLGDGC